MTKIIYDKGFSVPLVQTLNKEIINTIISKLDKQTAFINSTWLEQDEYLKEVLAHTPKKIVVYSGPDWENTKCRADVHQYLNSLGVPVVYVGNSLGKYYFCFWAEFVRRNLKTYDQYNGFDFDIQKTYMCLNRKPHGHRVRFVDLLKNYNLLDKGYVTLGADENSSHKPIYLEQDIKFDKSLELNEIPGIGNDINTLGHPAHWKSHMVNIVSETTTHSSVFISEKTFKPIIGGRPFIVLGDNQIYDVLHEIGIDTFDDILGTGYNDPNIDNRMHWACNALLELELVKDKNKLMQQISKRLHRNRKRFLKFAAHNFKNFKQFEF
jgi:hypothetical protein